MSGVGLRIGVLLAGLRHAAILPMPGHPAGGSATAPGGPAGTRALRPIYPLPMTIDTSWVAQRNAAFLADPAARLAGNAVATTDVEQVSLDRTAVTSIDTSVSDLVPDASITDQKQSGRCWAFAGLNVLRASMLKELELDSLELSQAFPFFYDKLEKANAFLTRVIAEADRPLDDLSLIHI